MGTAHVSATQPPPKSSSGSLSLGDLRDDLDEIIEATQDANSIANLKVEIVRLAENMQALIDRLEST